MEPFAAEMNGASCKRRKEECQGDEEGQSMQGAPFLIKLGSKPAEGKSQSKGGRKRAGGLLLKIQDSGGPETQPPHFTLGLTCQNTGDPQQILCTHRTCSSLRSKCLESSLFPHQVVWLLQENAALQMPQDTSPRGRKAVGGLREPRICTVGCTGILTPTRGILGERSLFF